MKNGIRERKAKKNQTSSRRYTLYVDGSFFKKVNTSSGKKAIELYDIDFNEKVEIFNGRYESISVVTKQEARGE